MMFSALVFAADMAAGEVATEPKRRRNMEAMVGNFLIEERKKKKKKTAWSRGCEKIVIRSERCQDSTR